MKKQFKSTYPVNLDIRDKSGRPLEYCGIRCSMEVLGGKWTLLIISTLANEQKRFSQIKKAIYQINDKSLTRTLNDLEYHKIIEKQNQDDKTVYLLTKYGENVLPVLMTLFEWGEKHIEKHSDLIFVE